MFPVIPQISSRPLPHLVTVRFEAAVVVTAGPGEAALVLEVREEDSLPAPGAEDSPGVGASLPRVRAPGTHTLEPLAGPQLGLPGGGGEQGAAVGDGELLPGPEVPPGLQHQPVVGGVAGGGPVDPAVWLTAVVHHRHDGAETAGGGVPEGVGGEDGLEPGGLGWRDAQPGGGQLAVLPLLPPAVPGQQGQAGVRGALEPQYVEPEGGAGGGEGEGEGEEGGTLPSVPGLATLRTAD